VSIPYLGFGLDLAVTVAGVGRMLQRGKAVSKVEFAATLQPAVESFEATFNVTLPRRVVQDVCDAAVDAVNKYVIAPGEEKSGPGCL
jgi:hypothetical protein